MDCANFVSIRGRHSAMVLSFDRDFVQAHRQSSDSACWAQERVK